jgi:SP family sugar:H+ symporter-like MFS transporter
MRVARGSRNLADIAVSFTLPYLLNSPYANLQSNIGWIYGSFAFAAGAFAYVHVEYTSHPSWEPWSLR